MTDSQTVLMQRAGALLIDAAGMLRMEAAEWRARKFGPHLDAGSWADRCERIASSNDAAATAMSQTAKKIAAECCTSEAA